MVSYITEKDESVYNVRTYESTGSDCDEEAIRFIESMPKRIPAQQDGKSVSANILGAFECKEK